ncbi:MAG: hypothetical protein KGZ68_12745 [Dechloromonas sp.]|nr:hypothetical protein [Dechloromonas sp.]
MTDVAFSRKGAAWQRVFLLLSNLIDGIAWLVMSEEMRNRPATVAPSAISDNALAQGRPE